MLLQLKVTSLHGKLDVALDLLTQMSQKGKSRAKSTTTMERRPSLAIINNLRQQSRRSSVASNRSSVHG